MSNTQKEERELANYAIKCYEKQNKRTLKQCKENVKKCDLNKLLPHINIIEKPIKVKIENITISKLKNGPNDDDDEDDDELEKGTNKSGKDFVYKTFYRLAKNIYKINDKENTFYPILYDDIIKENNGFLNSLSKWQIEQWLAKYETNRIRYVIFDKKINFSQFRILSKHKLRDQTNYLGFLPKKRRKKLYEEMVKFINNRR